MFVSAQLAKYPHHDPRPLRPPRLRPRPLCRPENPRVPQISALCAVRFSGFSLRRSEAQNSIFDPRSLFSLICRNHPGYRALLNTLGPIENFFPRMRGITPGSFHMWHRKHKDFQLHGWDVISYVRALSARPECPLTSA